ncbi:hypothetical protein [Pseudoduganella chitinolytica]|uniref:DUF3990 domain-containing protein n=1 Tax=Pseudoduganella chitinolytica TaxID=34070 RepID=A0ABY8BAL7_9BURK|nr:hypothetical protein [Pseudoduganella chitinolytica]WEF32945.1 hypothetical protein PX653_26720 [Pseudoduganella chitinolytica]
MKPTYHVDGSWYHGSTQAAIRSIHGNRIETSLGGGELGLGFYIGNYGHVASAWARHKDKHDAAVVELRLNAFASTDLTKLDLSWLLAKERYLQIGRERTTRTHLFHHDVVAAPIVGRAMPGSPLQLKWEGDASKSFLNSSAVVKILTRL